MAARSMKTKCLHQLVAIALVGAMAFGSGCALPGPVRQAAGLIEKEKGNILREKELAVKDQRSGPGAAQVENELRIYQTRLEQITRMRVDAETIYQTFLARMKELGEKGNDLGRGEFWLGMGGLTAGIAAAALTVASPANAVWIAALSGFAGGVAGMKTLAKDSGFTKAQIVAMQQTAYDDFVQTYADLNFGQLYTLLDANAQNDAWNREVGAVQGKVNTLKAKYIKLFIPTVGTAK